jgi:hypothetical protein
MTGDVFLGQYEHAYACYRAQKYSIALHHIGLMRARNKREAIQAELARAVVSYQIGKTDDAIRLFESAQRREALYSGASLAKVRSPTGGERMLLAADQRAFARFLPAAIAFEFVQKEDATLRRGVSAALRGDVCEASQLFADSVRKDHSSTSRWLNGAVAFIMRDRTVALASWFDEAFEPQNSAEQTFNEVQWSAVSLIIATSHDDIGGGQTLSSTNDEAVEPGALGLGHGSVGTISRWCSRMSRNGCSTKRCIGTATQ